MRSRLTEVLPDLNFTINHMKNGLAGSFSEMDVWFLESGVAKIECSVGITGVFSLFDLIMCFQTSIASTTLKKTIRGWWPTRKWLLVTITSLKTASDRSTIVDSVECTTADSVRTLIWFVKASRNISTSITLRWDPTCARTARGLSQRGVPWFATSELCIWSRDPTAVLTAICLILVRRL